MENAKYKNKMPKLKIKKFQLAKDSKHWIFGIIFVNSDYLEICINVVFLKENTFHVANA